MELRTRRPQKRSKSAPANHRDASHFKNSRSPKTSSRGSDRAVFDGFTLATLEKIGTPRALSVWLLYSSNEHRQLVELDCNPRHYLSSARDTFRKDRAATKMFSKALGLRTGIDKVAVALDSARRAEILCRETNEMIRSYRRGDLCVSGAVDSALFRASQIIARVLGPVPTSFPDRDWSPGRTTSSWGNELSKLYKYRNSHDVTHRCRRLAHKLVSESPIWSASVLEADGPATVLGSAFPVVRGNVMITVPKNEKTDRVICYEPHANIRVQLAVGDYLKKRLLKVGVDLKDQSVNRTRCRLARESGFATIDLSMASDTLSLELVHLLLPPDWAVLLDDMRSHETLWPDGQWRRNEKFSSMGNGFTFELESLVFYALCSAVTTDVSVFGDDIIVPQNAFNSCVELLGWSGFKVNWEKSYATGEFFESCGYEYFSNVDVTPFFIRTLPKSLDDFVHAHNALRDWISRDLAPSAEWAEILRDLRRKRTHHLGPSGYGDGHYHCNFEEACPSIPRDKEGFNGWQGYVYRSRVRSFRINSMYGDRVLGHFSGWATWSSLCVALGPRRSFETVLESVDRRLVSISTKTSVAFTWPSISFVS